jgi:hypothetical protein
LQIDQARQVLVASNKWLQSFIELRHSTKNWRDISIATLAPQAYSKLIYHKGRVLSISSTYC